MDATTITTALSAFKTTKEIVGAIIELSKSAEVNGKVIELQNVIMTLQTNFFEIREENANLTAEIKRLNEEIVSRNNWAAIEKEYSMVEPSSGVFLLSKNRSNKRNAALLRKMFR